MVTIDAASTNVAEKLRPKRRWFQFHLSTAIVLMFMASWLVWLHIGEFLVPHQGKSKRSSELTIFYGWPADAIAYTVVNKRTASGWLEVSRTVTFAPLKLAINIVLGLLLLSAVAYSIECLFRRRSARKPPASVV